MADRKFPFSINSLLTDNSQPQSPNQKTAVDLAECFPLIFGAAASVNLPFGLAQLLAKSGGENRNVEEEEENDEEEDEEMKMKEEEDEEEIVKEEMDEEDKKANQIEDMKNGIEKASSICANLVEQQIDLMQFPPPPNGWLFPFARSNGPPALPNQQHPSLARFPFLPPSFVGSSAAGYVKSSPLFPLFGPLPAAGGICTGSALQSHHQPSQNQHKRKGGQIRFSNEQTDTLENTFDRKKYLNNGERKKLAKALGLSERQVKTWFQNRRAKWRRQAPADSDDLMRSPGAAEQDDANANPAEQHHHLAGTAFSTNNRPTTFFANFTGLSD